MEKKFKFLKELINKNQKGLTLIEILVALVITSIVLAGLYITYGLFSKQFQQMSQRSDIYNSGRNIITIISRDLRMAGFQHYESSSSITNPILMDKGDCNQICIIYDVDDEKETYQRRKIIYFVENEKTLYRTIKKEVGTGTYTELEEYKNKEDTILAESIKKLQFTFFDKTGNSSTNFSKDTSNMVEVELTIKIKDDINDILSTEVLLRNVFYQQK